MHKLHIFFVEPIRETCSHFTISTVLLYCAEFAARSASLCKFLHIASQGALAKAICTYHKYSFAVLREICSTKCFPLQISAHPPGGCISETRFH